jgi:8-oxo-dGTP pyrophosphatase MutT (NUDIX family)
LSPSTSDVPVRDAATVALLRDASGGLEVYLLERSRAAVFSPGAHVFPGGALDDEDRAQSMNKWCGAFDRGHSCPIAYYIAAIRESFEEAGLLLAYDATGEVIHLDDPEVHARFGLHRKAMHAGQRSLDAVCAEEGLMLAVDGLVPFGHWITPKGAPRRFDTRFFAARAPEHQTASSDEIETTSGLWARPADVLKANDNGEVELIMPTRRSLEALAKYERVDDALAGVSNRK